MAIHCRAVKNSLRGTSMNPKSKAKVGRILCCFLFSYIFTDFLFITKINPFSKLHIRTELHAHICRRSRPTKLLQHTVAVAPCYSRTLLYSRTRSFRS